MRPCLGHERWRRIERRLTDERDIATLLARLAKLPLAITNQCRTVLLPRIESVELRRFVYSWGSRESVPVHRTSTTVETGFRVPANVNRPAVRLTFCPEEGHPQFIVEVYPWRAAERLAGKDTRLLNAARALSKSGFKDGSSYGEAMWSRAHEPDEYLEASDVPARLIEVVQDDVAAIVGSGILAYDLEAAAMGGRGEPPKVKTLSKKG
jgi:hypothetical protein